MLLLLGVFVGLIVPDAGPHLLVHPRHSDASLKSVALGRSATRPCKPAVIEGCHYGIT
jgi:hypothetical protein